MDTTPELANWPKDISMKTRGIPVMNSMIRNGIRKAPEYRQSSSSSQTFSEADVFSVSPPPFFFYTLILRCNLRCLFVIVMFVKMPQCNFSDEIIK